MREQASFLLGILLVLLAGCAHQIPAYLPDDRVTPLLRGAHAKLKVSLDPPSFIDDGSLMCRLAGPVSLPNGQSFSGYVKDALDQELKASNIIDETQGTELKLRLERVDFSSALGASNWFIDTEYGVSGQTFVVSTVYNDRSSYVGLKACANMAVYFRKAISEHLRQLFAHPHFRAVAGLPSEGRSTTGVTTDAAARLRQLDALDKDGLITKEEYEVQRKRILDGI